MPDKIKCTHCGEKRPALGFAPFPNALGQRIAAEICQPCWSGWLQKQTQIINHYGLDLTNPDAQISCSITSKAFCLAKSLRPRKSTQQKKEPLSGNIGHISFVIFHLPF